jgi:subtilisin
MRVFVRYVPLVASLVVGVPAVAFAQTRSPADMARLRDSVAQVGGRVIVMLKSSDTRQHIVAPGTPPVQSAEMDQIQSRLTSTDALNVTGRSDLIGAVFATTDSARLEALNNDPNVLSMEADRLMFLQETRDGARVARTKSQDLPWGISQITAPDAWALGYRGDGVKVGIMDSGGDPTHPDLVWAGGYSAVDGGTSPSDWQDDVSVCLGHGTHVAGTVAAQDNGVGVVGVAPNVSLYAIKVFFDFSGQCAAYTSTQITALQWAVSQHIRVVNASIGGGFSSAYQTAVDQAAASGTFLVAAAGNDNGGAVEYPAAYPSTIAVSSLNSSNGRSSFSSAGPQVWVGAPGENIESTMPGGTYGFKSGTSMATPHVTGTVALLVQKNPSITLAGVRQALQNGALDIDAAGFDNNTGWGLDRVAFALGGGSAPLTIAVAPNARTASVQQGSTAPSDNAAVTLSGTNASTTAWTAAKKASWATLTTASGTGTGTVAWSRNPTGLAVGTYVDTITVSATGATGSPTVVYDTLHVTAPAIPVTLAVTPAARVVSVQQGSTAPSDNGTITLTGTNAATTSWTATKRQPWTTLTTASGTGSGTAAWSRNATGLAVGTYVDTITITAPGAANGSPARIIDTMRVNAATIPVTMAVTPASRNVSAQQGTTGPSDNAAISFTGTNAQQTGWTAAKRQGWTTLTAQSGTGDGAVTWSRNLTGLAVGTYVDTITVTAPGAANGSPGRIIDTLHVTAAAVPVTMAVAPGTRNISVQQGTAAAGGSAPITFTGTNAQQTTWTATKRQAWTTLTTASGTGDGAVSWSRNTTGLAVGTYVDTIAVSAPGAANGSPATIFDTVRVTAVVVPVTLALSPAARSTTVQQGGAALGDNATVTLAGTNASTTAWTAAAKHSWTSLTVASGTGSGTVTWNRNATSLAAGTYVDTITVTAPGAANGSPAMIFDTLHVTAPVVALVVYPASRHAAAQQGAIAPGDTANVQLLASVAWTATNKHAWNTLTAASNIGNGRVIWSRSTAGLTPGLYVDTITVNAPGAVGSPSSVIDSFTVTPAAATILAVAPSSRNVSVQQGNTAPGDNATVTLSGGTAGTTAWTATKRQPWTTLTTATGTGSGTVAWTRNTTGLAAGTYVDTITVTAVGAVGSPSTVIDTLTITAAPVAIALTVSPAGRSVSVAQGGVAPGDNATVTLSGTNAGTAAWTATRKKSWTTLTVASGTGSGLVQWNRNASGLAAGVYVDTITVTAPGAASGSPATVFDTLRVTSTPLIVTVAPQGHHKSVKAGTATSTDAAAVTLSGTGASTTNWHASNLRSWNAFSASSGTGNGTVSWVSTTASLAVGIYVDTITVAAGTTSARIIDTMEVTGNGKAQKTIAVNPKGKSARALQVAGSASILAVESDSAMVQSDDSSDSWIASTNSSRLSLTRAQGSVNSPVVWQLSAVSLSVGMHIDTIQVQLASDASVQAVFVDSLNVVSVSLPDPQAAVQDLFSSAAISTDQRTVLDRLGNNNGFYDLGDFLAWVDRSHIHLTADVMAKLQSLAPGRAAGNTTGQSGTPNH